ncbi:hypothetical protein [Streptomyces sp. SID9727]|nr:hypothetical protein [Streptomyces sp. SID9727]
MARDQSPRRLRGRAALLRLTTGSTRLGNSMTAEGYALAAASAW